MSSQVQIRQMQCFDLVCCSEVATKIISRSFKSRTLLSSICNSNSCCFYFCTLCFFCRKYLNILSEKYSTQLKLKLSKGTTAFKYGFIFCAFLIVSSSSCRLLHELLRRYLPDSTSSFPLPISFRLCPTEHRRVATREASLPTSVEIKTKFS